MEQHTIKAVVISKGPWMKVFFVIPVTTAMRSVACGGQVTEPLSLLFLVLENARFHLEVNF